MLQDANYSVLGVVEDDGDLKERYEYTPYGERTIYKSAGSGDPKCTAPILTSQRLVTQYGYAYPHGFCDFGHEALPGSASSFRFPVSGLWLVVSGL